MKFCRVEDSHAAQLYIILIQDESELVSPKIFDKFSIQSWTVTS